MSNEIIKIISSANGKMIETQIFGLNIFEINGVKCDIELNPQLKFLREITANNDCAANIGNLFDYADSPEELFKETTYAEKYKLVRIGCYAGEFYDSKEWNTFPPVFFNHISSDFIDIPINAESLIVKILHLDALALFISPKSHKATQNINKLLDAPFKTHRNLIQEALEQFDLIMISEADNDYFTLFSFSKKSLKLIEGPVTSSVELIRNSEWYLSNKSSLRFDDENAMCLVARPEQFADG